MEYSLSSTDEAADPAALGKTVEVTDLTSSPSEVKHGIRMPEHHDKVIRGTEIVVRNENGNAMKIYAVWEGMPFYGLRRSLALRRANRLAS